MKRFPALMKSMNDRVRPSDELLEVTKQKMRAAIQAKEAPVKRQPVFHYSTALAGLALVIAGGGLMPHLTGSLAGLPYSASNPSPQNSNSGFSSELPPEEEESPEPGDTSVLPDESSPSDSSDNPPDVVVQPPLYPTLPPESNGKDPESPPNVSDEGGSSDFQFQYPTLYYSKRLPTLSELGILGKDVNSLPTSEPSEETPSEEPSSPSDAPIQSSGLEPPSGANGLSGEESHSSSDGESSGDTNESSIPSANELTDGITAPVVTVGDDSLYFQPISSITVSSWTLSDPENVEKKQWSAEEAISYFGRDPQSFALPQGMQLNSSDGYSVWLDKEGNPYYDSVGFEFANSSSSLTITMSKMGIPKFRAITMLNQQGSVLNGVSMQIGYKSVAGQQDTYTAEFVFGGIGYQIISNNLSQREFITLLQSIAS